MPLDPKYSNLPYIATGQPDVYESGDLPESDQQVRSNTEQSESGDIDRPKIDHAAAAGKFKGKSLDSRGVDFTDAIRSGRRTGYSTAGDLELLEEASRSAETPMQTFQRVQAELSALASAVEETRKSAAASDADQAVTPDQLATLIRGLQEELVAMHLDSVLGPQAEGLHVFDPEGCLEKRLAGQLERLSKQAPAGPPSGGTAAAPPLVYEVYTKPSGDQRPTTGDLEARLAKLEAAVGQAHLRSPALSGDLSGRPLFEAAHRLAGKMSLLEPASLDQLDSRLAALNHRLAQLTSDKREPLADADTQARVAELYELVKKWDGVADSVHGVVGRLTALKDLHEQAMQFSGALNLIDQSQRATSAQLSSAGALLAGLETRVADDLKTVQANTLSLQERLKAVGK